MPIRISALGPVLNEVDFIGYSIMAALEEMHQFIYALDANSNDGTRELLYHIKEKYAHEKLIILEHPHFHPHNETAYNASFDQCISKATGDAVMFLHPDQIITNPEAILTIPRDKQTMAWWVTMTSFASDFVTKITKGRATRWKNIHARKMGVKYRGGYGSQNEDFYHQEITGNSHKHYGVEFSNYPFGVKDSGLMVNHYCELKDYTRRLEKMKLCLKTLYPDFSDERIAEIAVQHPRVSLEESSQQFGQFEFEKSQEPVPEVFEKYGEEFNAFKKELVHG